MKKILLIVMCLLIAVPQVSLYAQSKREKVAMAEETLVPELSVVNNTLYIKNAPIGARLQIITIVGNKVRDIEIKSSDTTIELNLQTAIYIFKLEGVVRKFIIR
jgi:Trk K+ transport system NAD-binding subunit